VLDLTGSNLISYIRRIIEDAISRSPRFRRTLGKVTTQYSNILQFQDAQVTIKDVASAGNRLSPDYFLCKTYGRAILAKVQDHEGQFVEWLQEIDPTRATPPPGVYYLNVDSVDEQTNDVRLGVQTYQWTEGKVVNAQGSVAYLAPWVDGTALEASIPGSPPVILTTAVGTGDDPPDVDVLLFSRFLYLLTPTPAGLELCTLGSPPVALVPMQDYWYQQKANVIIVQSTVGGKEVANLPGDFLSFVLVDQTGYELRPGIDYTWYATNGWIELSQWTPPGQTVIARLTVKADPSTVPGTNPENVLAMNLGPGKTPAQVFIHTQSATYTSVSPEPDGTVVLPVLLTPGQSCRWEARTDGGERRATAKKFNLNDNVVMPGLRVAIGDNVTVGDQVAVIVSPQVCETYEVYGSKDNLDFTIDVRSNDLQTSSDLSEMLKQQLLVMRRTNMEADGVTIFEARRTYHGTQRDASGTAPQFVYTIGITAMADWKVFVPLVTRLMHLEITESAYAYAPTGRLSLQPRTRAFGVTKFIQSYS
jgi:hypothetical protein